MPAPDASKVAETLVLIQAQSQVRQDLVDLTQAQVAAQVRSFGAWYDAAQVAAWASRLAKLVRASQKQTAASTDAYALRILTLATGKRPSTGGPVKVDDLWGGVPLEQVFERLPAQVRWLESQPDPLTTDEILDRVVTRGEVQAETALSLAFREQWVSDLASVGTVTGYRRIIHPELGIVCGLCVAASSMTYKKTELMPLHGRCRCTVAPIVGEPLGPGDPGAAINDEDLEVIYAAAGDSTRGRDLKKTRFTVIDHPEYGPTLTAAGHSHRGPAEVAASRR